MAARLAMPAPDIGREVRTAVQGDNARLAIAIVFDQHVPGTLHDVKIAVVTAGEDGRISEIEAALTQIEILGYIGFDRRVGIRIILIGTASPCSLSRLGGFGRERRNSAIERIDYERGPAVWRDAVLPRAQGVNGR